MTTKLYILLTILPLGSIGLIIVEVFLAVKGSQRNEREEEVGLILKEDKENTTDE